MGLTPEDLGQKIRAAQEKQIQNASPSTASATPNKNGESGKALRAATDLVAALIVGGLIGFGIDKWLGTKPWGMIIFFFLGFAAGFMSIYKAQMGQDYRIGFKETKEKE